MYPVLIKIGPLTIHTYGFLIAVAFLIALWLTIRQAKEIGIHQETMIDLGFYISLAAIVGSRVFFVITNWQLFSSHPLDIIRIWEGGLVFYGGVMFAIPIAVWFLHKKRLPLWQIADIWAPSLAIGHAIGRLGCFCAGCCYGSPAQGLFWSVTFSHPESLALHGVPLHPAQLYEAGAEFLNFLILLFMRKKKKFQGQLFWMYILNYSIIRSVVELYRGDESRGFIVPGISTSQGISIVMFLCAVFMMAFLSKRQRSGS